MVDKVLPVTGEDVQAAVAQRNRINSIVSLDKDFDHIQGVRRLTPAQASA